jgi:hypothetical protein
MAFAAPQEKVILEPKIPQNFKKKTCMKLIRTILLSLGASFLFQTPVSADETPASDKFCKLLMRHAKALCIRDGGYDCGVAIARMKRTCFADDLRANWCEYAVEQSDFLCAPGSAGNGYECGASLGSANRFCR